MKTIEEQIKDARCATPDLPLHRAQLRRALLSSQQFEGSSLYIMKRFLPSAVLLLLIFGLSFAFHPENTDHPLTTPTASAQEVLANVVEEFQSLTDEEIAALNEKLGMPCGDVLTEARNASDLHLIEVQKTTADGITSYTFPTTGNSIDGELAVQMSEGESWDQLTFLEYTDPNGALVQLGIDVGNGYIPAIILMTEPGTIGWTINADEVNPDAIDSITVTAESEANITIEGSPENLGETTDYGPVGGETTVDENGCTHWTSEDGTMGGGGC